MIRVETVTCANRVLHVLGSGTRRALRRRQILLCSSLLYNLWSEQFLRVLHNLSIKSMNFIADFLCCITFLTFSTIQCIWMLPNAFEYCQTHLNSAKFFQGLLYLAAGLGAHSELAHRRIRPLFHSFKGWFDCGCICSMVLLPVHLWIDLNDNLSISILLQWAILSIPNLSNRTICPSFHRPK